MPQKWQITKEELSADERGQSGKGIPKAILDRLGEAYNQSVNKKLTRSQVYAQSKRLLFETASEFSEKAKSANKLPFSEFSFKFNLEDYESDEEEELDPLNINAQLDVTALDRYNEDVRKYRRVMLEECRQIPLRGDVERSLLEKLRVAANNLGRSCYYGTYKAHALGESSVMMFIWLLSRTNLPIWFHMRLLQSLTELVWGSHNLKATLRHNGVRVLVRIMRGGMSHHSRLATWACYALLAAAVGCGEVVKAASAIPKIEEYLGEIAFPHYWRDWPANFGSILEGIVLGPHTVSPIYEDEFQLK